VYKPKANNETVKAATRTHIVKAAMKPKRILRFPEDNTFKKTREYPLKTC
jgi:hypothetical protein